MEITSVFFLIVNRNNCQNYKSQESEEIVLLLRADWS